MSQDKIVAALSKRLEQLVPLPRVAWPNETFTPPDDGSMYLSVAALPGMTENPAIPGDLQRHVGVFQVNIHVMQNTGTGVVRRQADALIAHFPYGGTYVYDGVTVLVTGTPSVAQGFHDGAWYVVPVSIFYRADVFQ